MVREVQIYVVEEAKIDNDASSLLLEEKYTFTIKNEDNDVVLCTCALWFRADIPAT